MYLTRLLFLSNATQRNATFSVLVLTLLCNLFFGSCAKEIAVTKIITITFNTNGGSAIDPITVDKNTTSITTPTTTRSGYVFAGWYTDEALTTPVPQTTTHLDFSASPITASLTLYAKWQETDIALTAFSIPSKNKVADITEDLSADIDQTNLTITLVINIPSTTNRSPLNNLTPTITCTSDAIVVGNPRSDYSINSTSTLIIKNPASGKTKTYTLIVAYASFYVKLGDVGTGINKADIVSYDIELYTPKYKDLPFIYSWQREDNTALKLELDIKNNNTLTLPYAISNYVKSSDDAHIVVYGKNAAGTILVTLYAQSRTSATGKGITLSINVIPDGQGLVIAHVNSEVWTANNWVSVFGNDILFTATRNLELSRAGNGSYSLLQEIKVAYEKNNYYQVVLTPLILKNSTETISQASIVRAYQTSFGGSPKSVEAPLNMQSYRVAKPTLTFTL